MPDEEWKVAVNRDGERYKPTFIGAGEMIGVICSCGDFIVVLPGLDAAKACALCNKVYMVRMEVLTKDAVWAEDA